MNVFLTRNLALTMLKMYSLNLLKGTFIFVLILALPVDASTRDPEGNITFYCSRRQTVYSVQSWFSCSASLPSMAGLQHDGVGVRSQRGPAKLCMAGGGDVAARCGGSKAPLGGSGLKGFLVNLHDFIRFCVESGPMTPITLNTCIGHIRALVLH